MTLNITLLLLAGALVVLMQAGFGLVVCGLCRAKNSGQVISSNLVIFAFSVIGFWVCGFGFMSAVWPGIPAAPGLSGQHWFFMHGTEAEPGVLGRFFFQAGLISIAAVIPVGAMAERWRFGASSLTVFLSPRRRWRFFWELGVGRRLAFAIGNELRIGPGICRFCRRRGHPHGGRNHRTRRRRGVGAAHWKVTRATAVRDRFPATTLFM